MHARLQRRVQRYGWDLAATDYEALWRAQLADAHDALLRRAALRPGEHVLDVACGSGLVAFRAADAVTSAGHVVGVDLSGRMIDVARAHADQRGVRHASFARMDAEQLAIPDARFDVSFCALGLMYMPDPGRALREMKRVLKPGGRLALAVWGMRERCGWSPLFPIVDAEVESDVCPLFFRLGESDALAELCRTEGLSDVAQQRITATLDYRDGDEACAAAFIGGPAALAWSRFDADVRARACQRYLDGIAMWRLDDGSHSVPGEFVIVSARKSPDR
jgi:ubiquinone/menaquinone biosynthesis C-methylase UbiE